MGCVSTRGRRGGREAESTPPCLVENERKWRLGVYAAHPEASVAAYYLAGSGRFARFTVSRFHGAGADSPRQDRRESAFATVLHRDGAWLGWQHGRWIEQTLLVA